MTDFADAGRAAMKRVGTTAPLYRVNIYDDDGMTRICFNGEPVYLGPLEGARSAAAEVFAKRFLDPTLQPMLKRAIAKSEVR